MSVLINKIINHTITKLVALSTLSLVIAACTQTEPARVQDISSASSSATAQRTVTSDSSDVSSTYSQRPSSIVNASTASTSNRPITTATTDNSRTVTTQERMVYTRNYEEIPKGGYQGDSYTVQRGDTLFYVAWITGNDYRALALKNKIKEPYALNVGQVIDVSGGTTVVVTEKTTTTKPGTTKPTVTTTTTTATTATAGASTGTTKPVTNTTTTTTTSNTSASQPIATVANLSWQWPSRGKVIETFSNATKGIDISGSLGDKVVAAAGGRVVYAGNALPGYGNLIIVKHNDDYLTAYAHNQSVLVKEQQDVKAGQQIATMGNTGTSSVRLHFEIRYKAKSVDPLKYLPKQ